MLGGSYSFYVSKNSIKSKVVIDENLEAEATSYKFATKNPKNQVLSN
jgi:hypothetical protein